MFEPRIPDPPYTADASAQPPPGEYVPFAASPLWERQRQYFLEQGMDAWSSGHVPHYAASNPSMARTYALVVLGFWRDLKRQGKTAGQPLYIIELGAGAGRFAYHFLLQFFSAFDALCDPEDKACYVMTDLSPATVNGWRHRLHERLAPFVARGHLDMAVFDAEADNQLTLQQQGICLTPNSLALPPVVIANYVFGSIRQDLFFLDKERIYEGWLACAAGTNADTAQPFADLALDYRKRRIAAPSYPDSRWRAVVESYAQRLPPCALLFPSFALAALSRLSQLNGGNLLLLSADRGTHAQEDLAGKHEPDMDRHGSFSLSVDYHAIATVIGAQGGRCWASPAHGGLAILAACWQTGFDGNRATNDWRETAWAAQQALQLFNPNDFYRIKQALEAATADQSPEQMLAFLRLSGWDTKVFYLMYPYLYDILARLPAPAQREWWVALTEVWRHHLPIGEDYDLAFDLGCLAAELNRWPAAIEWFVRSLEHIDPARQQVDTLGITHINLGIAHWQRADYGKAEACLLEALALLPDGHEAAHSGTDGAGSASRVRGQLAALRAWRDRWPFCTRSTTLPRSS